MRKRVIKNEINFRIVMDIGILLMLFIAEYISFYALGYDATGYKNLFVLTALQLVMAEIFMYALEEYSPVLSGFWEQCVIIVLSSLYSWVITSVINLIIFKNLSFFAVSTVYFIDSIIGLVVVNFIHNKILSNVNKYPKQKLLIIETHEKNFMRMKRIKYGTLNRYDSWYEFVDTQSLESVKNFADEMFPQFDVICILEEISDDAYDILIEKAMEMNKELYIVPKTADIQKNGAKLVRFDDIMGFYMSPYMLSSTEKFIKRFFDIVIASIGLVVAIIPMAIIAAAIKITSPGPILYKQKRLTEGKREFEIYKFRTMIPDAEKLTGPVFAQKDDPRITGIGKILRACRLDELPQIINILKGDMSIVGPRPERPSFIEQFEKEVDSYDYRFRVKAGLTALSHVYGRYSTYIQDRTYYDLYYISHYSILLDLKIILLTTKTMFLRSAAEGDDEYKLAGEDKKQEREVVAK